MRQFFDMIFFGKGIHSVFECEGLIDRIRHGFGLLSGIQQQAEDETAEQNIKDIVSDVAAAFGFEIEFKAGWNFPNKNISNMQVASPQHRYIIRVFERDVWRQVKISEFCENIGIRLGLIDDDDSLTLQQAEDALNFLTHGHKAYLGTMEAPCIKFEKNRFYAIFPVY